MCGFLLFGCSKSNEEIPKPTDPGDGGNPSVTHVIYYTTSDGKPINPKMDNIIKNVYENGQGAITIAGEDTEIGIGDNAFSDCDNLTSITFPETLTTIGKQAFSGCSSLTSITIPEGVTTIGSNAFKQCSKLASITLPEGVTTIGDWTFSGCISLTSITIPEGVTTIGRYAFNGCSSLTSVYCKPTTPPTLGSGSSVFPRSVTIFVPSASVNAYKSANGWSYYASKIVGYDF